MNIHELQSAWRAGELAKHDYIERASEMHRSLFAYVPLLKTGNISKLEVDGEGVRAFFREPPFQMWCIEGDSRIAPIEALNFGDYEQTELQTLKALLEKLALPNPIFFDVGANAGFYSLALAKYFPSLRTVAFEPVPETFNILQRNILLNELRTVTALNMGLSEKPGELIFYTYPGHSAAASSARLLDSADCTELRCRVDTLDNFCADRGAGVDLLKCDVEGAELFVFRGGQASLTKYHPIIFAEMLRKWSAKFQYNPNEIISLLGKLDYVCYALASCGLRLCPVVDEATQETNFIFLHREKHGELPHSFLKP